jgi:hypothetical protein
MAHSSPGQARDADSMIPNTGSLSDSAENVVFYGKEREVPFEQQDHSLALHPSPAKDGHDHEAIPQGQTSSFDTSEETMLLEKPPSLSRLPDLERGYQFGPAVRLAPDHFTKIKGRQVPIQQHNRPQHVGGNSPVRTVKEVRGSQSQLPSMQGGSPANATSSSSGLFPHDFSVRSQASNQTTGQNIGENRNSADIYGLSETRKHHQAGGRPPFPDSPDERPSTHTRTSLAEERPVASVSDRETKAQRLLPTSAAMNEAQAGPGARTTPDVEQHCDHSKSPRYEYYRDDQEDSRPIEKGDKADEKHHYSSLLRRGESRGLVGASKPHTRNQMANRPLRETGQRMHKRPADGSRPSRPESRSSNVSKPRLVTFPS